jgi:hypothetical protein
MSGGEFRVSDSSVPKNTSPWAGLGNRRKDDLPPKRSVMSILGKLQETAPFLFGSKGKPSHQQVLGLRPMRHPGANWERAGEDNLVVLSIRRRDDRWANLLSRVFGIPPERRIELTDELSSRVWELCDGKHTVGEISRLLSADYKLGTRQAEVSVLAFLRTLQSKRLVGIPADQAQAVREQRNSKNRAQPGATPKMERTGYHARRKQRAGQHE